MEATYLVGGAVRDELLGLPSGDRDWVVVGSTPQAMAALGYMPVGKDFPVFLHPQTKEEYALARTERKTAPGYHGFQFHAAPEVTLEQDLARRDLSINAMAQDDQGRLIDPYGGQRDLAARVLRHVSPAFAEDPVRILRLARFAARLHDFSVAPETLDLMRQMVDAGEVDALVAERVWQDGPVWIWNLEDGRDELERRVTAAILHLDLDPAAMPHPIFLNSGRDRPLCMAEAVVERGDDGATVTHLVHPDEAPLIAEAKANAVRMIVVDPFVSSHTLNENSNPDMAAAMAACSSG